ncbi:hypothetical protein ACOSQ2_019621 [Xanthoceras sorbifolium]
MITGRTISPHRVTSLVALRLSPNRSKCRVQSSPLQSRQREGEDQCLSNDDDEDVLLRSSFEPWTGRLMSSRMLGLWAIGLEGPNSRKILRRKWDQYPYSYTFYFDEECFNRSPNRVSYLPND